jgi:glucose-6-phosphate 1-dehydrogenase
MKTGPSIVVSPMRMHFDYAEEFGRDIPDAYERLLLIAMLGDASLFARDDEAETTWEITTPILETWSSYRPPATGLYGSGAGIGIRRGVGCG